MVIIISSRDNIMLSSVNTVVCSAGDLVEDAVKNALGVGDKDEDEKKGGGILSLFGGDKDKNETEKDGLFSFGDDKKKEDEKKGGFFSKIFDRDDDEGQQRKSGFAGLFNEQEGGSAAGSIEGQSDRGRGGEDEGHAGPSVSVGDGGKNGEPPTTPLEDR